jgi:hypothetical protein
MALAVITVNVPDPPLANRNQEAGRIDRALNMASGNIWRAISHGETSGDVTDAQDGTIASWTYSPVAENWS